MWKRIIEAYQKLFILHIKILSKTYETSVKKITSTSPKNICNYPKVDTENKWLVNLTSKKIPDEVSQILCLGKNFGVPILNNEQIPIEYILAAIESNMDYIDEEKRNKIRNLITNQIFQFCEKNTRIKYSEINELINITKQFKKNNPELVFTKADKGNVTVVVERSDYVSKIEAVLKDEKTYRVIKNDPTLLIEKKVNKLLNNWFEKKFICKNENYFLLSREGNISIAYGLPKIHKESVPFRIIVSFIGTPTYQLAKYLQKILLQSLRDEQENNTTYKNLVINSFELVEKIRNLKIPSDFVMISMDVVSLFTNVPQQLVIAGIKKRWKSIKNYTQINQKEFINGIILCMNASAFKFNGILYQQIFGAAMGSPLSPVIAEIVLRDLEDYCLKKLNSKVYFYTRYVDDILVFLPPDKIADILFLFNNYHDRLKFTLEREENFKINFLEITLIRSSEKICIDWYKKPTSSGRYLNYNSHHPRNQKIGTIYNLIDRAILLSDVNFHRKNVIYVRNLLRMNNYPKKLLNRVCARRETFNLCDKYRKINKLQSVKKKDLFVCLPYVAGLSESLQRIFRGLPVQLTFKSTNNLSWLFTGHKDQLLKINMSRIVFKIPCAECNFVFVDQTRKKLSVRLKELWFSIQNPHIEHLSSALSQHAFKFNHNFFFEKTKIVAKESNMKKRQILALIYREKFSCCN